MFCTNCGEKLIGTPNFCGKCGSAIAYKEEVQTPYTSNENESVFIDRSSEGIKEDSASLEQIEFKESSSVGTDNSSKRIPQSISSQQELFMAAIEAAMQRGEITDLSIIDRQLSGTRGDSIALTSNQGRRLARIYTSRAQEIINKKRELGEEWSDEILEVWNRASSQKGYDPGLERSRRNQQSQSGGVNQRGEYDAGLERSSRSHQQTSPESKELVFRAGIFFSGKGLLAIAIPAGYYCLLAVIGNLVLYSVEKSAGFVTFLGVIAITASAYTTWKIGKKLNRKKEAMHTLYFIPLEKWAFIQIIVFIAYFIFR